MDLSINDYINFVNLLGSMWGWLSLSLFFIVIAQFRPFMVIALMCFYPTIFWSASWKPAVTLYPIYPLIIFLCIKYLKEIAVSFFEFRYRFVILLSVLIIIWSFFSPLLYPASYGPSITFSMNPNYQRGILSLAILLFIPAVLRSREDLRKFLFSSVYVFMAVHILVVIISAFFLLSGNSLNDLHLMRLLETPPVYWESGLLLIGLAYFFVRRKMGSGLLIVFCILACAGLVLGNSRTRFLATFWCLLYFVYPYINRRLIAWTITLTFLLSASLVVLPKVENYFFRLVNQRIEQSVGKKFSEMATGRISAYKFAYHRWKESPLVGVGPCYILPRSSVIYKRTNQPMPRIHNYYLEVLAGQGIVGFGLLIIVLGISLRMIFKISIIKAKNVIDGRLIVALFLFGIINWFFKESWGITYSVIALLSVYNQLEKSV